MKDIKTVPLYALRPTCDPALFDFVTTEDITDSIDHLGQDRALEALEFGVDIDQAGYHLYAIGQAGIGKLTFIKNHLKKIAKKQKTPPDWCYLHNFDEPNKPIAIHLPAGLGEKLRKDMSTLVDQLRFSIPAVFESEEFRLRLENINDEYKDKEESTLNLLQEEAEKHEMAILKRRNGFSIVPTKNGEILTPKEIEGLSKDERNIREKRAEKISKKLNALLSTLPQLYKEKYQKEKDLEKEFCSRVVNASVKELKETYSKFHKVVNHLNNVEKDIIEDPKDFLKREDELTVMYGLTVVEKPTFTRYQVNVLISNGDTDGAPIVFEANPNYSNLIGKIEYKAQLGMLISDFTMIKPGALHKANGGYLILDIFKVLMSPYSWESLKRILLSNKVVIEPIGQMLGVAGTTPLEPEATPIHLKIILLGNRQIYNLLGSLDQEFKKLFKVAVEFENRIERSDKIIKSYATFIASFVKSKKLIPFHKSAIARIIDHCIRLTEHSERISLHMQSLDEIIYESNHCAARLGHSIVKDEDVQCAIDTRIKRVDLIRSRLYEEVENNTLMIDVEGKVVGQINGISVIALADFTFGHPSRITATTRLGHGTVIDIERAVKLSGPLHSKGVLILSGFLKGRYVKSRRLSLSASVVFEQTYGMVDGDSASLAELCVLLSSLSDIAIDQSYAVTGSVNQHGSVQAVGGINEKIEGFFDICQLKGLTGRQAVLIPASNVKHLMLRQAVVDAVKEGKFNVYPVETVDQALTLLTGVPAGERDSKGLYPADSVNGRCEQVLEEYADSLKGAAHSLNKKNGEE